MSLYSVDVPEPFTRKKVTKREIERLKKYFVEIARKYCPKDTTNMAMNGIYAQNTNKGFAIIWDSTFAYYMPYVNEGKHPFSNSAKIQANKGFVDVAMCAIIQEFQNFCLGEQLKAKRGTTAQPLFVKMLHDIQKNKNIYQPNQNVDGLVARLMQSVKKYKDTNNNEVINFEEELKEFENTIYVI